ncbi:MAG: hypothetical protein KJZ77_17110 [Anaerolineales bacterium]|nr:hypothetical protein [Anaerolineales bacterium]
MYKKFQVVFALFLALSLVMSACGSPAPAPAEPVAVEEQQPETAPEVVVEEEPVVETGPDALALFTDLAANLPADKGYGSVGAAALNTELVEKDIFLLDVREAAELEKDGYIDGTVNIPVRDVLNNLDKLPGLDDTIVVLCASGHRGGMVMAALRLLGYTDVRNLGGGLNAWKKAELPVVTGSMPQAPEAISTPIVDDQPLYEMLNGFFVNMPEGFYAINAAKLSEELTGSDLPFIVDVRSQGEWDKDGYIEGSINLPFSDFFANVDQLPADKDARIVILCASGHRGGMVMMALRLMGYTDVVNLGGGLNGWKAAGMPVVGVVDWPATFADFITNLPAEQKFYSVAAADLNQMLVENPPFIVDVRQASEIETNGYIEGAIHIEIRELMKNLDKLPGKDEKIVIMCASGHRGGYAMVALRMLGYTEVFNLNGGMNAWKKAEFGVVEGMPEAAESISTPDVDAIRLAYFDNYLSNLDPAAGFGSVKNDVLNTELAEGKEIFLLDIRRQAEWDDVGHIDGAVLVPLNDVPANLDQLPAEKDAIIVVICASGHRGTVVQMYLQSLGYTNVRNLNGGMGGWIGAELPVVK